MVKLALGTAREFQQFLPELLKEVEDTGDSGFLFAFGVTKGCAVDMDVQAAGFCLMGQIPHLLGGFHDLGPRHLILVKAQRHGMGDDLKTIVQAAIMLDVNQLTV